MTFANQTQGTGFPSGGVNTLQDGTPSLIDPVPVRRQPLREHIPAEEDENQSYTQNETDICRDSLITANQNQHQNHHALDVPPPQSVALDAQVDQGCGSGSGLWRLRLARLSPVSVSSLHPLETVHSAGASALWRGLWRSPSLFQFHT